MTIILNVNNLGKKIGRRHLLQDVNFEVHPGEIFGFLGPNGAGKTTTMRIITGLMKPTTGKITICGHDITKNFYKAMIQVGAIVENPESFRYLTGWQNLEQAARASGLAITKERMMECVETVGLTNRIQELVKGYSLGMKQRLGIAQAILTSPKLLILDEPTNGMDPRGVRDMRDMLHRLSREQGMAVFISTHLLLEAQAICDRVAILDQGVIVARAKKDEIDSYMKDNEYIFYIGKDKEQEAKNLVTHMDYPVRIDPTTSQLVIKIDREGIPSLLKELLANEIDVFEVNRKGSSLEEYFINTTKENL